MTTSRKLEIKPKTKWRLAGAERMINWFSVWDVLPDERYFVFSEVRAPLTLLRCACFLFKTIFNYDALNQHLYLLWVRNIFCFINIAPKMPFSMHKRHKGNKNKVLLRRVKINTSVFFRTTCQPSSVSHY